MEVLMHDFERLIEIKNRHLKGRLEMMIEGKRP
jgi:hypothetical protein